MRLLRLPAAIILSAAVLAVPVAADAAPAAVPTAPYTAFTGVTSGLGSQSYLNGTASTPVRQAGPSTPNGKGLSFTASGGSQGLGLYLSPATPVPFAAGTYSSDATGANRLIATLGVDAGSCAATGTVVIAEITYGGSAAATTSVFAADYDLVSTCSGRRTSGSVRWNSAVGYEGLASSPETDDLGTVDIGTGRDATFTVASNGSQDSVFGADSLDGNGSQAFTIGSDTCAGTTVAAGSSCVVKVHADPVATGAQSAVLSIARGTAQPLQFTVTLTGRDPATGTYYRVTPARILDTRDGTGTGGNRAPIGQQSAIHLAVNATLPAAASAVVLNVTVDHPTAAGFLTLWPTGAARPNASSINFPAQWVGANLVTVPVGAGGQVDVFNSLGATNVVADLVGWYAEDDTALTSVGRGGGFHPKDVERLLDTRTDGGGQVASGDYVPLGIRYNNDGGHIAAVSVTVTVTNPHEEGYLTTWNGRDDLPPTSTLNFTRGATVSNAAVVPVVETAEDDGNTYAEFAVYNGSVDAADIVVDVNGYFDDGVPAATFRFKPLATPTRIVDTRTDLGTTLMGPGQTHSITPPTTVAGYDTIALDMNVTAVQPTNGTFLTLWPSLPNYPRPNASAVNPFPGQTVADHAIAEVGTDNVFNLYNLAGTVNVLMDVSGSFEQFPPTPVSAQTMPGGAKASVAAPTGGAVVKHLPRQRLG